MNKTQATKAANGQARFGYFAHGVMEGWMNCPVCKQRVQGFLPRYAKTYDGGVTYFDKMVTHLMEEH